MEIRKGDSKIGLGYSSDGHISGCWDIPGRSMGAGCIGDTLDKAAEEIVRLLGNEPINKNLLILGERWYGSGKLLEQAELITVRDRVNELRSEEHTSELQSH